MKVIWIIAKNTYLELIRDRVLYGLIVFAVLLMGLSLLLGELSFAEQSRISANFGFTAIHLSMVILSIFVGSTLVAKEIEKKTILTLLARPLSRLQFLIGKCLGLSLVTFTVVLGLGFILGLVFFFLGVSINLEFLTALFGILLESLVLLGVTIFFGSFATPMMVVAFSIGIFTIGHWLSDLAFFAQKSRSLTFDLFSEVIAFLLPNLEKFNWRSAVSYHERVGAIEVGAALGYSVAWFVILITLTSLILRRKDFA
ncbi:MAG: ABC transporter permease [Bdellovibrionales bacterium]|nr:ABC transporter permease [Bdellovibrionales bacterium]